MQNKGCILISAVLAMSCFNVRADTGLNSCNASSGECKALLESVYIQDGVGYAKLEGGLIPSTCTSASWGTMWKLPLDGSGAEETYAMLLSALVSNQVVQLRTFDEFCTIRGAGLGM